MTSSFNSNLNQFNTQIQEITIDNKENALKEMFNNSLKYFSEKNKGNLPKTIIIYREGGNEWKNKSLANMEIPLLQKLKNSEKNFPKIYYIAVNLNSDIKFYQIKDNGINSNNDNKYSNPKSGLIVDDNVTQQNIYEFYLQPQLVNQGTANPTQFQVMYYDKEDELSQENLEKLTFYLCFYYWTWSGAVRIPAILKMAMTAIEFCVKCDVVNKNLFEIINQKKQEHNNIYKWDVLLNIYQLY